MEELFSRLKSDNSTSDSRAPSSAHLTGHRAPLASSPSSSPAPPHPFPYYASNSLSPDTSAMNTPQPEGAPRATDLLSLLKFRQGSSGAPASPAAQALESPTAFDATGGAQSRGLSTADFSAMFSRKPSETRSGQSPSVLAPASSRPELRGEASGSSANPQDFLLKLLNQGRERQQALPTGEPPIRERPETVSEAVNEVGETVNKQVELALAHVASRANGDSSSATEISRSESLVQEAAKDIKKDLQDEDKRREIETGMPKEVAKAFEETIDAVAHSPGPEDSWEDVADKDAKSFTLPMEPFKSISILELEKKPHLVPAGMVMDIARAKRPFDQIDRNLVAGTQNIMAYPLKQGGVRVIRQETGAHKEIFKGSEERIFNISVTSKKATDGKDLETLLGTGVNGSAFWAPLSKFASSDDAYLDSSDHGFVFPPVPSTDENTSGGQLKTRIKPSTRHPEFFGYARGKSIYIIYPDIAKSPIYTNRDNYKCNGQKYIKDHMLRISTGKAGKDFIFSSDDSVIASLDKSGKLKFWDIRMLTQEGYEKTLAPDAPLDIKVPLMTLATSPASEKSWPTSILLFDKEKPMAKGIALRYMIIGLKQNHTLQLWDLQLGKPVQEINFPHQHESDAICSVVFHPKTAVITVAHPTRNSIYFVNLSIPPYTHQPFSQARFVNMIGEGGGKLPTPRSTVIAKAIREYKFSENAIIRSIDILSEPGPHYSEESALFVLYIMHSSGISELKVDRHMLGLTEKNAVINGVEALGIPGTVKVEDIKALPPIVVGDNGSVTSEGTGAAPSTGNEEARNTGARGDQPAVRVAAVQSIERSESSGDKVEKKKKKGKISVAPPPARSPMPAPRAEEVGNGAAVLEQPKPVLPVKAKVISVEVATDSAETKPVGSEAVPSHSTTTPSQDILPASRPGSAPGSARLEATLKAEFEALQHSITQDRLKQDAAATSRQEAVLKAVSRTLTENVEDSLARVVTEGLTKVTLSPLQDVVASTVDRNLSTSFNQAMKVGVPRELQKSLPLALGQALKDKSIMQATAEQISLSVTKQVDAHFSQAMQTQIAPAISKMVVSAAKQMTGDMERRFGEQLRVLEFQKQQDNSTIDGLIRVVGDLQETIQSMAQAQDGMRQDTMAMLAKIHASQQSQAASASSVPPTPAKVILSAADQEREDIQHDLARQAYEEAALKWMHSERKVELFDEVFIYVDPHFVRSLGPLVILSVAATASEGDLATNTRSRLQWVDFCVNTISTMASGELSEVLPQVLDALLGRIRRAYMDTSQEDFQDPLLKEMAAVAFKITDLKGKYV